LTDQSKLVAQNAFVVSRKLKSASPDCCTDAGTLSGTANSSPTAGWSAAPGTLQVVNVCLHLSQPIFYSNEAAKHPGFQPCN